MSLQYINLENGNRRLPLCEPGLTHHLHHSTWLRQVHEEHVRAMVVTVEKIQKKAYVDHLMRAYS
jgi:hypothetical protein